MIQEFIPYEQAVALKELGFNEPCFGYWKSKNWLIQEKTRTDGHTHADQECSAPLYQQAFRWFREEGFLIDFSSHDKDIHEFYLRWSPNKSILSDTYKTYEEAELECLKKLIEIVKQELEKL